MRALLAALILCACAIAPARASYLVPQASTAPPHAGRHQLAVGEAWSGLTWRRRAPRSPDVANAVLSSACRIARALGGPCGCFTSEYFFGHSVRELWLADAWLKFPRTSPHSGAAAVWPHRHVAPVIAVNGDGTVTVRDFWAVHRVRVAGLVFVDPRAALPPMRARHARA
jgi:hypothetical protein